MSDTARRLAEEKYPDYIAPSWEDGATKGDAMPSVDASWQNAEADMQRAAFLAGWEAREEITEEMVEAAAKAMRDLWWPNGNPKIEASDPVLLEATRAALSAALRGEERRATVAAGARL